MKTTYTNNKFTLVLFVIYTVFYESLVWGLTACSIYFLQWSEWTILVGIIMSSLQLKYKSFYVKIEDNSNDSKKSKETNSETIELDLGKK